MKHHKILLILPPLILSVQAELADEGPPGAAAITLAHESRPWTALAGAEWANRYLSEGRENWDNSGIFALGAAAGTGPLGVELWQGISDSSSDREFQATAALSHETGGISYAFRTTWISDTRGGDDWEFGISATGEAWLELEWSAELYHALEPNGAFLEVVLSRGLGEILGWEIEVGADAGANFGYVRDGHRGINHLGLRLEGEYAIGPAGAITAGLARYIPIGRNVRGNAGDADLFDGWHFRIGAQWNY